jgi:hypothetical protein
MSEHDPAHGHGHDAAAHDHAHGHAHPPAEEDVLPSGKVYLVGVIALVVFVAGSVAAGMGMRAVQRQVNPDGPVRMPEEAGKPKIGMVEQRLFENANMGPVWREAALRRLESFGWVDREKGIVHIPIGQAMELVEKGVRP